MIVEPEFKPGDQVLVCAGPRKGDTGVVVKLIPRTNHRGHDLVAVKLDETDGHIVSLWLYPSDLQPATDGKAKCD